MSFYDPAAAPTGDHYDDLVSAPSRPVAKRLPALAELGIHCHRPHGQLHIDETSMRIRTGWVAITASGSIGAYPCEDVTLEQWRAITQHAMLALMEGPTPQDRWRRHRGGWLTAVYEPIGS